jgi:hypothetical protein
VEAGKAGGVPQPMAQTTSVRGARSLSEAFIRMGEIYTVGFPVTMMVSYVRRQTSRLRP